MGNLTPQEKAQLTQYINVLTMLVALDSEFFANLFAKVIAEDDFDEKQKMGLAQIIQTFGVKVQAEISSFREQINDLIKVELYGDFTDLGYPEAVAPVSNPTIKAKMLELIQQQGIESGFKGSVMLQQIIANPAVLNIINLIPGEE